MLYVGKYFFVCECRLVSFLLKCFGQDFVFCQFSFILILYNLYYFVFLLNALNRASQFFCYLHLSMLSKSLQKQKACFSQIICITFSAPKHIYTLFFKYVPFFSRSIIIFDRAGNSFDLFITISNLYLLKYSFKILLSCPIYILNFIINILYSKQGLPTGSSMSSLVSEIFTNLF